MELANVDELFDYPGGKFDRVVFIDRLYIYIYDSTSMIIHKMQIMVRLI